MQKINQKYEKLILGSLIIIKNELDRLYWNKNQKEMDSPFENTGKTYENKTFKVCAYKWNENNDEPNFNYKNKFFVYWYKYCGRGMLVEVADDVKFDINFLADMVNECLKVLNDDKNLEINEIT